MTLSDMAEFTLSIPQRAGRRFKLLNNVVCALCGFDEVSEMRDSVVCESCFSRICILCGCVDGVACIGGCTWMLPGVCSAHDGDLRLAKLAVPEKPVAVQQFRN